MWPLQINQKTKHHLFQHQERKTILAHWMICSLLSLFPEASCSNCEGKVEEAQAEILASCPPHPAASVSHSLTPCRLEGDVKEFQGRKLLPMYPLENPRVSRVPTPACPEKGGRTPIWLGAKSCMNTLALLWRSVCTLCVYAGMWIPRE